MINDVVEPWPTRASEARYRPTRWEPLVTLIVDHGRIGGPRPIVARRTEMFGPGGHYAHAMQALRCGTAEVVVTFTHAILGGSWFMSTAPDEWRRTVKLRGGEGWSSSLGLKLARPIVVPVRQRFDLDFNFSVG